MFLTAVKPFSLKLQTKHPGFWVDPKAPTYTLLIAVLLPSPVKGLAQRVPSHAYGFQGLGPQTAFSFGFSYCFSKLQHYFIASAL